MHCKVLIDRSMGFSQRGRNLGRIGGMGTWGGTEGWEEGQGDWNLKRDIGMRTFGGQCDGNLGRAGG